MKSEVVAVADGDYVELRINGRKVASLVADKLGYVTLLVQSEDEKRGR